MMSILKRKFDEEIESIDLKTNDEIFDEVKLPNLKIGGDFKY